MDKVKEVNAIEKQRKRNHKSERKTKKELDFISKS